MRTFGGKLFLSDIIDSALVYFAEKPTKIGLRIIIIKRNRYNYV